MTNKRSNAFMTEQSTPEIRKVIIHQTFTIWYFEKTIPKKKTSGSWRWWCNISKKLLTIFRKITLTSKQQPHYQLIPLHLWPCRQLNLYTQNGSLAYTARPARITKRAESLLNFLSDPFQSFELRSALTSRSEVS